MSDYTLNEARAIIDAEKCKRAGIWCDAHDSYFPIGSHCKGYLEVADVAADLLAKLRRVENVHAEYFDMDSMPGETYTNPEPEDVWRYDRDFRDALRGPTDD